MTRITFTLDRSQLTSPESMIHPSNPRRSPTLAPSPPKTALHSRSPLSTAHRPFYLRSSSTLSSLSLQLFHAVLCHKTPSQIHLRTPRVYPTRGSLRAGVRQAVREWEMCKRLLHRRTRVLRLISCWEGEGQSPSLRRNVDGLRFTINPDIQQQNK